MGGMEGEWRGGRRQKVGRKQGAERASDWASNITLCFVFWHFRCQVIFLFLRLSESFFLFAVFISLYTPFSALRPTDARRDSPSDTLATWHTTQRFSPPPNPSCLTSLLPSSSASFNTSLRSSLPPLLHLSPSSLLLSPTVTLLLCCNNKHPHPAGLMYEWSQFHRLLLGEAGVRESVGSLEVSDFQVMILFVLESCSIWNNLRRQK